MSKQDRQGVRTAQDLERKYEFADQTHNATEARRAAADAQAAAQEAKAAVAVLANYIESQGTYGVWKYEKWSHGKAVCWCTTEEMVLNFAEENAFCVNLTRDLPSGLFVGVPSFVSVSVYAAEGFYNNVVNSVMANAIGWSTVEQTATATARVVRFVIEVKGEWK